MSIGEQEYIISSDDESPLSDLARGRLAVPSHVSKGVDLAITIVTFLTRNDGFGYSAAKFTSSGRFRTPSFSNSSNLFH